MREETRIKVDEFLIEHGCDITELKTDKEVLNKLIHISLNAGTEIDYEYMVYEKIDTSNMTKEEKQQLVNDHLDIVHNFELIEKNANIYASQIRFERKEERKLVRREKIQKVLSIFKKR